MNTLFKKMGREHKGMVTKKKKNIILKGAAVKPIKSLEAQETGVERKTNKKFLEACKCWLMIFPVITKYFWELGGHIFFKKLIYL